jgi:hypothetical protein
MVKKDVATISVLKQRLNTGRYIENIPLSAILYVDSIELFSIQQHDTGHLHRW